jgi:hypothetical protein
MLKTTLKPFAAALAMLGLVTAAQIATGTALAAKAADNCCTMRMP